jgi:colanic acid/amylovoran biosynthesis protein
MNDNILIINVHSSRNLGDAALLQVTLNQLKEAFPTYTITISMDDSQSHLGPDRAIDSIVAWTHPKRADDTVGWNYFHLLGVLPSTLIPLLSKRLIKKAVYTLTPKKLQTIVDAYLQADIVISGPGGFLYSSGKGISLFVTVYSIAFAALAKKPVYILPQSIGPLKHKWEKTVVKWILKRARIVMVREPISLRLVREIGVDQGKVCMVPDLAFAMPKSDRSSGEEWLEKNGIIDGTEKLLLGMTIINWGKQHSGFDRQEQYEAACASAARWFIEQRGGKVILFPQVFGPYLSQDDRVPARRVMQLLPELSSSFFLVEQSLPLELLKSVYSHMDVFIGTRMHSCIFALSEDVPTIMIGYLPKTRGLAEMLGLNEWCVEINQVLGNELIERLQNIIGNHIYWQADKKKEFEELISKTNQVGGWVKDDFEQWVRGNQ